MVLFLLYGMAGNNVLKIYSNDEAIFFFTPAKDIAEALITKCCNFKNVSGGAARLPCN